jgi:hypothetical protein
VAELIRAKRLAPQGRIIDLQRKLTVGAADDQYEQEADRVAGQVLSMPDAVAAHSMQRAISPEEDKDQTLQTKPLAASITPFVQRQSTTEEEEIEPIQTKSAGSLSDSFEAGADVESQVDLSKGRGSPLPDTVRAYMEPRFGVDFSEVRVHTGSDALRMNQAVGAQAFTHGSDIYFGAGHSPNNLELTAHELTHVVQQTGGIPLQTKRLAEVYSANTDPPIQRKLEVGAGLTLDTRGFTTTRVGDVYTCPAIVKNSIWNEIFTSLLFSPRVFKIAGTSNAEINANLNKHMASRLGIVDFASKKLYTFAAGSAFKMNPTYWIVDATGWRLKPGVDRDKAIQDLNVHPKEYAIACLAATQLTMVGGGKSPITEDTGSAVDDWIPGDWGYITNTKFPSSGGIVGLEGENIIYTGKDKFWGHFGPGLEYKTLKEWFDQVKGWNGGAQIEDSRKRPTIGLA